MIWLITMAVVAWVAIRADRSAQDAESREWEEIMGTKESDE